MDPSYAVSPIYSVSDALRPALDQADLIEVRVRGEPAKCDPVALIADFLWAEAGRFWFLGNGGSAATAQHLALDGSAAGLRTASLPDVPTLTAFSNDWGFEAALRVFLERNVGPDDRVILLSVSGRSGNILQVAQACAQQDVPCLAMVGFGGKGPLADIAQAAVAICSENLALVEFLHLGLVYAALERSVAQK